MASWCIHITIFYFQYKNELFRIKVKIIKLYYFKHLKIHFMVVLWKFSLKLNHRFTMWIHSSCSILVMVETFSLNTEKLFWPWSHKPIHISRLLRQKCSLDIKDIMHTTDLVFYRNSSPLNALKVFFQCVQDWGIKLGSLDFYAVFLNNNFKSHL